MNFVQRFIGDTPSDIHIGDLRADRRGKLPHCYPLIIRHHAIMLAACGHAKSSLHRARASA